LNFSRDTAYPDLGVSWFSSVHPEKFCYGTSTKPLPLPSSSFPIHYSFIILLPTLYTLLKTLLNNPQRSVTPAKGFNPRKQLFDLQKHPPTYTLSDPTTNMFVHLSLHPYLYPSACILESIHLRNLCNDVCPSKQLLSFWTLSILLFLFKTHSVSKTGFCLRLQVEPTQAQSLELVPISRYLSNLDSHYPSRSQKTTTPVQCTLCGKIMFLCWYYKENLSL
jgi:hypothetical protein